ncbi:MAG TPA: hypothetical protein VFQ22_01615 [Longimicrobiales bacterium]|nr:hypothetical protein [Longimicrobiales bacterium]
MSSEPERRYDDEEVAAILADATDTRAGTRTRVASGEGLTLAELHEIADEVGIPRELVTRAAKRVEARRAATVQRWMGVPVGVGRTLELPRALTDGEWHRLVARLRETFAATGRVEVSGDLRQWWNGNLRVAIEPAGEGHRLRMTTLKGDLRPMLAMGSFLLTLALVLYVVGILTGATDAGASTLLGLLGAGTVGLGIGRMPLWARTRSRQMEEIAAEVADMVALPPAG